MPKDTSSQLNIQFTNLPLLEEQLKSGLDANKFYNGMTLLDIALIHDRQAAATLLRKYGAIGYLSDEKIYEHRRKVVNQAPLKNEYTIKNYQATNGKIYLDITELETGGAQQDRRNVHLSQEELDKEGYVNQFVVVMTIDNKKSIVILDKQESFRPVAVFQLSKEGNLAIRSINDLNHSFVVEAEKEVSVCDNITAKKIQFSAQDLNIHKNVLLQTGDLNLQVKQDFKNEGALIADQFYSDSVNFLNDGHIRLADKFQINCTGRFEQKGEIVSRHKGQIRAHAVENHSASTMLITDGELKVYGSAFVKNSGSILADYLVLDSDHIINNNYGALIKAVTCIVPLRANQFNNAGFYLVGRKNHLTVLDKALNYASAATEIAGVLCITPQKPLQAIKTSLLLAKTLYHAAGLLSRLYSGQNTEITSSEYVHFFLDHVLPSVGSLSEKDDKTKFICNVFYQLWGWYLGEDDLVSKSLAVIEMIVSGAATLGKGKLKPDDVALLQDVAKRVAFSKHALKLSQSAIGVMSAYVVGSSQDKSNAKDTISAMTEVALRDLIEKIAPEKIFGIEFNPKDLALFVLNQGHQQSNVDIVKRTVYSLIYALHKSEKISDSVKAEYQLYAQTLFSGQSWMAIYQRYEAGQITYSDLAQQLFNHLTMYASYKATINQINTNITAKEKSTIQEQVVDSDAVQSETLAEASRETQEATLYIDNSSLAPQQDVDEGLESDGVDMTKVATESEVIEKVDINAEKVRVEFDRDSANVQVIINLEEHIDQIIQNKRNNDETTSNQDPVVVASLITRPASEGMKPEYVQAMMEVQRALDGDYASQGYLGIFAGTLHNHGLLDAVGSAQFVIESGNNSNLIRVTDNIYMSGKDPINRDDKDKVINSDVSKEVLSRFHNEQSGNMKAGGNIHFSGIGQLENSGSIHGEDTVSVGGSKVVRNYEKSSLTATESVDVFADFEVQNSGHVSAKNVFLEGTLSEVSNSGNIFAQEEVKLVSQHKTTHHKDGSISTERLILSGPEIEKSGSVSALFVKTSGYDVEKPDEIIWRSADDHIYGLTLNPGARFQYDSDAFNGVQITDLQLSEEQLGKDTWLSISPEFKNILQLQLPHFEGIIAIEDIPQFNQEATFVLNAPGTTLNCSDGSAYQNTLRYKGAHFQQQGSSHLREAWIDTDTIIIKGGASDLFLEKGGVIQSKKYTNEGYVHADGVIHWNVDSFTNDAQIRDYVQWFQHSKENPVFDQCDSTEIIEKSGTIHAYGHTGYIGHLEMTGGTFTSGLGGNHIYAQDGMLRPIFTQSGVLSRGVIEDVGWSWHLLPESHNAQIGSSGENILLGTGKLISSGSDIWGDSANHVHFNEGVHEETESRTYVIQQAREHSRGKNRGVTVPYTVSEVISQNHISSNSGPITIGAANGSISLTNTVFSSPMDAALIAKDKVTINGEEVHSYELAKYKERGLNHRKSVCSESESVNVSSSYLFVGGTLLVSCLDFELSAVSGVVGHVDVTALTTQLSGKNETFKNTTVTKSFSIGLPGENLVNLLSGHNAKAIFTSLVRNCGWDPDELSALANAKNIAEIPAPLLNTAKSAWNLTALVAHACNEWGTGSPTEYIGSITDQIGLTTQLSDGSRIPNLKMSLNWSSTTENTESNHIVASNLYIGGTFKLFGSKLIIADGSKIDANDLLISLAKGIEMTKGSDKYSYSAVTKTTSLDMNLNQPTEVGASVGKSSVSIASETVSLALLQGRESAHISVGESIVGEGRIISDKGVVSAPHISLVSAQSSYTESSKTSSVFMSTNFSSSDLLQTGFSANQSHSEITSTEKAGIFLENGVLETNNCNLEKGSVVAVRQLQRLDGEEGLPVIAGSTAIDRNYQTQRSTNFTAARLASEPGADLRYSNDQTLTAHQPSVYADNITASDVPGINTDRAQESVEIQHHHSGYAVAGFVPNKEKYQEQAKEIQQATKGLHFLFKKPTERSLVQESIGVAVEEEFVLTEELREERESRASGASISTDTLLAMLNAPADNHIDFNPDCLRQQIQSSDQIEISPLVSYENPEFSPMPGVAQLQNLPAAKFFLAQLSANEIRQLAEMVVAFENGDPEHKLAKVQQSYASSQQEEDTFSKFLRVINPVADAHAIAPALPLAATYLLGGLGILAYKSKLEQSGSDYVANQQAQMNALMMSPTADYYTQLGVWVINGLTTKPNLPDSSTGFPIHQLDEDPYITPVPSTKAHGEQPEHIPMQDMLGQILSQPVPEKQSGPDVYSQPLPPNSLQWTFDAYKVNGEEFIKTKDHDYYRAADYLAGFPGSYEVKGKTPKQNGGVRKRWETDDGKILDWDYQHGEVEMYTKNGKHLGAYDPDTGMKKKDAKKERNIKKFL